MAETSKDTHVPKSLAELSGFLSFVSSIVGTIATIFTSTSKIYQGAQDAWPILGPLTFYVGIAAFATFLFTFALFRPIVNFIVSSPSAKTRILQVIVVLFGIMELFFALREGGYNAPDSKDIQPIAQVIGAAVLLFGCFAIYRYLKPIGGDKAAGK